MNMKTNPLITLRNELANKHPEMIDMILSPTWDIMLNNNTQENYPPYNIIKHKDTFVIEVALAGFKKDEISVSLENTTILTIKAEQMKRLKDDAPKNYIRKGIGMRSVLKKFTIPDNCDIVNCEYVDGILRVFVNINSCQSVQDIKIT